MPGVAICNKPGVLNLENRMEHSYQLEVALAGGPEDRTRAILGLTIAAAACAAETRVEVHGRNRAVAICNLAQARVI
jgi:hypothetical protein